VSAAALPFAAVQSEAADPEPITVSGRVVAGFGLEGLSGVHVTIDSVRWDNVTDDDGNYTLEFTKAVGTTCVIRFELKGHLVKAFFYNGELLGRSSTGYEINIDSTDIVLPDVLMDEAFGTLEGKVTFKGRAVSGVTVEVHDLDSGEHTMKTTNDAGLYSFILPVGVDYIVSISSPYYYAEDKEVAVDDLDPVTCDFELEQKIVATYLFSLDFTHSMMLIGGIIGLFLLIFAISYRIHIGKHPESSKIHSETKKKDQE
ncbi:MAG: carboxypeptidase-like regulatory domain-containing protein, partial [Methanomassiliicoccaceae archaeon]|jgi:hypothetical protein|nr:carboxypeptidase-like regulatory domain-containing protein [Methanomassiliicoccaceae archaeon]